MPRMRQRKNHLFPLIIMIESVTMDSRKIVLKETLIVAVGELLCCGIMVAVFIALGFFEMNVLWGALVGFGITVANFFFMAMVASLAADRAEQGQVQQGKKLIQISSIARLACIGIAAVVGYKLGANIISLVLPLAFVRPVLLVSEFFRKKGD